MGRWGGGAGAGGGEGGGVRLREGGESVDEAGFVLTTNPKPRLIWQVHSPSCPKQSWRSSSVACGGKLPMYTCDAGRPHQYRSLQGCERVLPRSMRTFWELYPPVKMWPAAEVLGIGFLPGAGVTEPESE